MTATAQTLTSPATLDSGFIRELDPVLYGYARKRVRSEEVARDLVQDTWVAAMKALPSFAGRSSLRTWVISILRRKVVDHYRRGRPQVSFIEEAHGTEDSRDVGQQLDDAAALALVHEHLEDLGERERKAITLELSGASRDAAAEELGVTRNHLRVLLHRGRGHLRDTLAAADLARAA